MKNGREPFDESPSFGLSLRHLSALASPQDSRPAGPIVGPPRWQRVVLELLQIPNVLEAGVFDRRASANLAISSQGEASLKSLGRTHSPAIRALGAAMKSVGLASDAVEIVVELREGFFMIRPLRDHEFAVLYLLVSGPRSTLGLARYGLAQVEAAARERETHSGE